MLRRHNPFKFSQKMYSITHNTIILIDGNKYARVALTKQICGKLGEVDRIMYLRKGQFVYKNQYFGKIDAMWAIMDFSSPFTGKIVSINEKAIQNPGLVDSHPEDTWLVEIEISVPEEIKDLMSYQEYIQYYDKSKNNLS